MAIRQTVAVLQGDDDITIFNVTETISGVTTAKDLTGWEALIVVRTTKSTETTAIAYDTQDVSPRIIVTDPPVGQITVNWNPADIANPKLIWHRLRVRHTTAAPIGRTVSYGPFRVTDT